MIKNKGDEICKNYEDISLIGRDLANIIIVDDNENSFKLNEENGIKISKFKGYQGKGTIKMIILYLK